MKPDDTFERWKGSRADVDAPAGFADRVMSSVEQFESARQRHRLLSLLVAVAGSRLGRVAIWSLACAACAARVGGILVLFLPA